MCTRPQPRRTPEHLTRKRRRGRDSVDAKMSQRVDQPRDRLRAIVADGDHLGDDRVVVRRDRGAREAGRVDAARQLPPAHTHRETRPGSGRKVPLRALGVDRASIAWPLSIYVLLRDRKRLARGDPQLLADQIDPGDHLRDAVLDLKPRVHLEEAVRLPLLVDEELAGRGAAEAQRARSGRLRRTVSSRSSSGDSPGRAPPRSASGSGAGACSRGDRGESRCHGRRPSTWTSTCLARSTNRSTNRRPSPNACLRLRGRRRERRPESSPVCDEAHTAPAAACGQALRRSGKPIASATARASVLGARPRRSLRRSRSRARWRASRATSLSPLRRIASGDGPMNTIPASAHACDSSGRSDTEAVPRVQGVTPRQRGRGDQPGDVEVALPRLGGADADRRGRRAALRGCRDRPRTPRAPPRCPRRSRRG